MKSAKDIFSTPKSLLKLIELILCIFTLVFVELSGTFYDRWVYEMLIIGVGTYILICAVLLMVNIQDQDPPETLDHLFMLVGAVLNILAGIMTMVHKANDVVGFGIPVNFGSSKNYDIIIGIFGIGTGVVMLIDFVRSCIKHKISGGGGGD